MGWQEIVLLFAGGVLAGCINVLAGGAGFSTLAFALAPTIKRWLEHRHNFDGKRWIWLSFLLEFIVYVYGGYFGLGMGVVLLALYAMFGHDDIHEANSIRNATITLITLIAIALFARAGVIRWLPSLVMMLGAFLGGYFMIKVARRVPQKWVRWGILAWSTTLTAIALWRYAESPRPCSMHGSL